MVSLFCLFGIVGCSEQAKIIATVDDTQLLEDDAIILMSHLGYNPNDSTDWQEFIQFWIDRQVFLEELKVSAPESYRLVELRSNSFAGELSRYYLEEEKIASKLDKKIEDSTIQNYYNVHKDQFALNDYIVKALYLKIPNEAPEQEKVKEFYLLKKNKDFSNVISYAKLYADNFYYNDSSWIYFDELTKDIPIGKLNKDHVVLNRLKTHFSDSTYTYFINVIDYKLKDAIPPLEFMRSEIEQIIITKRLNEIREKNESLFLQNIKDKHEITIQY